MLKLTAAIGGLAVFVNPRLVTDIVERTVYDQSIESAVVEGGVGRIKRGGQRVDGCLICFGGPEDSVVTVLEAAEDVAREVAKYDKGGWGIVDVAQLVESAALEAAEKARILAIQGQCPDCDDPEYLGCMPF